MQIKLFFNEEPVVGKYEYIIPKHFSQSTRTAANAYQWFVEAVNTDKHTVSLKTINPAGDVAFKEAAYVVSTVPHSKISDISMQNGKTWFYFGFDTEKNIVTKK